MCNFSRDDVLILARAIVEDPVLTMSGDFVTYLYCEYCDAELHGFQYAEGDFIHDVNCPVLVAQDILTK
jgi:hypothetical protein